MDAPAGDGSAGLHATAVDAADADGHESHADWGRGLSIRVRAPAGHPPGTVEGTAMFVAGGDVDDGRRGRDSGAGEGERHEGEGGDETHLRWGGWGSAWVRRAEKC